MLNNLQEILKNINTYLPKFYTNKVLQKLELEKNPKNVRRIQNTKAGRTSHKEIQIALIQIAMEEKKKVEGIVAMVEQG